MNQELADYIQQARNAGHNDQQIKDSLLSAGWSAADVEAGLNGSSAAMPSAAATPAIVHPEAPGKYKKVYGIAGAILAVLVVGGYFVYAYAFNSPQKVWGSFGLSNLFEQPQTARHVDLSVKYTDAALADAVGAGTPSNSSSAIGVVTDLPTETTALTKINLTYALAGSNVDTGPIEIRKIGNVLYLYIKSIPFVGSMADSTDGWIKVDLDQLKKNSGKDVDKIRADALNEFTKILNNHKVISDHTYLGSENIDGASTYHYSFVIDKGQLEQVLADFVDSPLLKKDSSNTSQQIEAAKKGIHEYISNLDVKTSEVWIGKYDHLMHKFVFNASMPSLAITAVGSARAKGTNAKMMADARQVAAALEIYYNDQNGYPDSLDALAPTYIGPTPVAPKDNLGQCAGKADYIYKPVGSSKVVTDYTTHKPVKVYSGYTFDFCLSGPAESFSQSIPAGLQEMSEKGLVTKEPHPEWTADADSSGANEKASLLLQLILSAKSKVAKVEAPEKSTDILNQLENSFSPAPLNPGSSQTNGNSINSLTR